MRGKIFGFDLQRQTAYRTAVLTMRHLQLLPVSLQNREDALDRIAMTGEGRLHDHRLKAQQVVVQERQKQRFLAGKEMVEAAGIGVGALQQIGHAGGGVALFPKEMAGCFQQPVPGR